VLITEDGSEVLSPRVPKSIKDIEALMHSAMARNYIGLRS